MTTVFIETERLILRSFRESDLPAMVEMFSDPRTIQFLTVNGKPPSQSDVWRGMAIVEGARTLQGFSFFAVEEKGTGSFVGRVGPLRPPGWPDLEVGWGLHPAHRGKGYAAAAARASVAWCFAKFTQQKRIIHVIVPENEFSAKVAKSIGATPGERWRLPEGEEAVLWESCRPK